MLRREGFANQATNFLESLVSALGKDGPVSLNGPLAFQVVVPNQVDLAGPSSSKLFLSILQQLSNTACHHWCHVEQFKFVEGHMWIRVAAASSSMVQTFPEPSSQGRLPRQPIQTVTCDPQDTNGTLLGFHLETRTTSSLSLFLISGAHLALLGFFPHLAPLRRRKRAMVSRRMRSLSAKTFGKLGEQFEKSLQDPVAPWLGMLSLLSH